MVHSANGHRTRKGGNSGAPPDLDTTAPALHSANGDGATGRVAQGAVPAGPRAVGPPRPVRRAPRGVRASG